MKQTDYGSAGMTMFATQTYQSNASDAKGKFCLINQVYQ